MKKVIVMFALLALALPGALRAQVVTWDGPPEPPQGITPPPPTPPDGSVTIRTGGMRGPGMHVFGDWWKDSEVAKQLELTPDQIKLIEKKFLDSRLKLIDERADLEKQETLLGSLMDQDQPEEATVSAQLDKVVAARGRLEKENAMMMLSIRRVLSVDQWKKLQTLQHERERRGGSMWMRREGPEGGPGPGRRPPRPPQPPPTLPPQQQDNPEI